MKFARFGLFAVLSGCANGAGGGPGAPANHTLPTQPARACPSGIGAVGVWQNITPPQIAIVPDSAPGKFDGSGGIIAVAVDPKDPATVYTAGGAQNCCSTGSNGIFKSSDCGATWTKLDTGRNSDALDRGWQWATGIVIDWANSEVMYAESGYGANGLWKSTNGGVDWDQLFAADSEVAQTVQYNFTQNLAMDPGDSAHLVVTFHANCTGAYAPMCMAESTDAGSSWRLFKGPTTTWQEGAGAVVLSKTAFLYSAPSNGIYYSKDSGGSWAKVGPSGAYQPYYAPDGTIYLGSYNGVLHSTDGATWTPLANSPSTTALIGDGVNLYAAQPSVYEGQMFLQASLANPTTWTKMNSPALRQGPDWMAYDAAHAILYSADSNAGLWRVVTQGAATTTAGDAGTPAPSGGVDASVPADAKPTDADVVKAESGAVDATALRDGSGAPADGATDDGTTGDGN